MGVEAKIESAARAEGRLLPPWTFWLALAGSPVLLIAALFLGREAAAACGLLGGIVLPLYAGYWMVWNIPKVGRGLFHRLLFGLMMAVFIGFLAYCIAYAVGVMVHPPRMTPIGML